MKKLLCLFGLFAWSAGHAVDTPFNTFVSGLPGATTPAGTELLPCVQGGTTKKCTTAQVSAAIPAGTVTLAQQANLPSTSIECNPSTSAGPVVACNPGQTNLIGADVQIVNSICTANIASLSGAQTCAGGTTSVNQVVLLVAQTTTTQNGMWLVNSGAWTRPGFFPTGLVLPQYCNILVMSAINTSTGQAQSPYLLSTGGGAITVDTTAQTWSAWLPTQSAGIGAPGIVNSTTDTQSSTLLPAVLYSSTFSLPAVVGDCALIATTGGSIKDSTYPCFNAAVPLSIGSTTPAAGAFTTLSASSTVSGTGFSTYLASPPAIGGTVAAAGKFTTMNLSSTLTMASGAGITLSTNGFLWPSGVGLTSAAANVLCLASSCANFGAGANLAIEGQDTAVGFLSNTAGGSVTLRGGQGTGNAAGSTVTLATSHATTSGATGQAFNNQLVLGDNTAALPNISASSSAQVGTLCYGTSGNITYNVSGSCNGFASSAAPVVSACGTSPSIDANASNKSGLVTVGTVAAASCTVTFSSGGYSTWNHCRVTSQSTIASFAYTYTTTAITVAGTSLVGDKFDYSCDGV